VGVQQADLQTISLNVYNLYSPMMQALPAYGACLRPGKEGFHNMRLLPQCNRSAVRFLLCKKHTSRECAGTGPGGRVVDAAARAGRNQ